MALWVASPRSVCVRLGWGWSGAGGPRNKRGGSGRVWGGMVGPSRGRVWEHLGWWGEGVPLGTGCS